MQAFVAKRIQTLSAMDVLAPTSMKNAAKCDTSCELQNQRVIKTLNAPCTSFGEYVCWSVYSSPPHIDSSTCADDRIYEYKKRMCIRDGTCVVAYFFFQVGLSDLAVERRYDVNIDVYVRVSFFLYGECGELTSIWTSNQSRIPAEFKHITRRRKRN